MIWSSRARNRSPDFVVACFFGRIVPSDTAKESCFASQGNPENEIARFRGRKPQNLAISTASVRRKTTLNQRPSRCSRTTDYFTPEFVDTFWIPFLRDGKIEATPWEVKRPATPYWLSLVGLAPIR